MKLAEFAAWVIREGVFEGFMELDGYEIQKKAAECGLLTQTKYDPAIHGENEWDAEPGDDYYVFSDELKSALKSVSG